MRIGLLASGALGLSVARHLLNQSDLIFLMTDKNSEGIIQLSRENDIPCFVGNPRGGKCQAFIVDKEIEVLLSVNYLFLIEEDLIALPSKLAFNIHGSLLPKYRGRTPHVWAIINNEVETGITAHRIDTGCDTGDIIEQVKIPIDPHDTGADILQKYNAAYIPLVESVLDKLKQGTIIYTPQENAKATFFGKRTPEDGKIDWNWQKERIRNWVRAQAYPYPGAFALLEGKKLIIDELGYDDTGFEASMPNGLILSVTPLLIKTPNGVIRINKHREIDFPLEVGNVLK